MSRVYVRWRWCGAVPRSRWSGWLVSCIPPPRPWWRPRRGRARWSWPVGSPAWPGGSVVERSIDGGTRLAASVRALQAEGLGWPWCRGASRRGAAPGRPGHRRARRRAAGAVGRRRGRPSSTACTCCSAACLGKEGERASGVRERRRRGRRLGAGVPRPGHRPRSARAQPGARLHLGWPPSRPGSGRDGASDGTAPPIRADHTPWHAMAAPTSWTGSARRPTG